MIDQRKIYIAEFTTIILLWVFAIILPLLFMGDFNQDWRAVHVMWSECIVVGVAFLINRFLLMPYLFFAKRYTAYFAAMAGVLAAIGIFILRFDGVNIFVLIFDTGYLYDSMPHWSASPPYEEFDPMMPMPSLKAIPPTVSVLIASILVMALDLGLRIASSWIIAEQKNFAINRERITSQLQNLQSQVSPHFFMNTLNNIHALVDIDSARAKQTIIELSDLMSYLLYDCSNTDNIQLQRELDFMGSYINLMRLRFSAQVKINYSCEGEIPHVEIPPLLFLNFIENAFKYGVDYEQESIINIHFTFSPTTIELKVLNSNHAHNAPPQKHGLGISNSRRRLDLIYGNRYSLDISDKEKIYFVNLKIPIQ